jgi:hypothetical protein
MPEIEFRLDILNLRYTFRGMDAFRALKEFCDAECSEVGNVWDPPICDSPTVETATDSGNPAPSPLPDL